MKQFASTTWLILFSLVAATSFAQQSAAPKPQLFTAFPETISCNANEIARIFTIAQGQQTNIALASNFAFSGTIASNETKYGILQTAVIKVPAFNNAIFHVAKRTKADNSIVYTGRIINDGFGDGYELKRDATGNYQLIKIKTEMVTPDCAKQ
jgi:hypothetical protein